MEVDFALKTGYHGYLFAIAGLDAEWSRHNRCDPTVPWNSSFERAKQEIERYCAEQKGLLESNFRDLYQVDPGVRQYVKYREEPETGIERENQFADFLLSPVTFVPFGHSDVVSIFLVDDFDIANEFAASFSVTIEELSLGCCPIMRSRPGLELKDRWFIEPHDFVRDLKRTDLPHPGGDSPLLSFSRIKMDSLGLLGEAVLFQEALFHAIAGKISSAIHACAEDFDPEEIASLRCTFIDLFGQEEMGILIGCNNYSLAAALSVAAASTTYGDVFRSARETSRAELEELLKRRPNFEAALSRLNDASLKSPSGQSREPRPQKGVPSDVASNHAVRWTKSFLGVHADAFLHADRSDDLSIHGAVEATSCIQLMPGHHARFIEKMLPDDREKNHLWVGMGAYDVKRSFPRKSEDSRGVDTIDVIEGIHDLVKDGGGIAYLKKNGRITGTVRNMAEMTTDVMVPVPNRKEIFPELGERHFTPFSMILPSLRYNAGEILPVSNPADSASGRFDLSRLRKSMRDTGFPVALRRSVEFLFQNFVSLSSNPFLFDAVIDLCDPFVAFFQTICDYLPRSLQRTFEGRPMLFGGQIELISDYVDALHRAMEQRLFRAFPDSATRQMSVDFRCGFNQLVFAANAPVICVVGLFRRYQRFGFSSDESNFSPDDDDSVGKNGVFPSIGYRPSIHGVFHKLGTEQFARLGFIEIDLPHIFHVPSLCNFIHESLHFVYEGITEGDFAAGTETEKNGEKNPNYANDLEETFVHALFFLMVCGGDEKIFLTNILTAYSTSIRRIGDGPNLEDDFQSWKEVATTEFTRIFNRIFFAVWIGKAALIDDNEVRNRKLKNAGGAKKSFRSSIQKYSRLVRNYDEMCAWEGQEFFKGDGSFEEILMDEFNDFFSQLTRGGGAFLKLTDLVNRLRQFYFYYQDSLRRYHLNGEKEINREQFQKLEKGMERAITKALRQGQPVSAGLYESRNGFGKKLDPLMVVCTIFRQYLRENREILNALGKQSPPEFHLPRRTEEGKQFPRPEEGKEKHYCPFLIHSGSVSQFCCIPQKRAERIRRQVSSLKSLWNISAFLKGKRIQNLLNLAERGFPPPPDTDHDAIVSYHSDDEVTVGLIVQRLRVGSGNDGGMGKRVYFDRTHLRAGTHWEESYRHAIKNSRTALVFYGHHGIGACQEKEIRWMKEIGIRQIPILLNRKEPPGKHQADVAIPWNPETKKDPLIDFEALERIRLEIEKSGKEEN